MSVIVCSIAEGLAAIYLRTQVSISLVKAVFVVTGLSCSVLRRAGEQQEGAGKAGSLLAAIPYQVEPDPQQFRQERRRFQSLSRELKSVQD